MENGRIRTSRVHVRTYKSYIFVLNSTSRGWLTYRVKTLASGVDPSHAHCLPSHSFDFTSVALYTLAHQCTSPVGCLSHLSSISPPKKTCYRLIPVVSPLWSQPSIGTKDKGWAGQSTSSPCTHETRLGSLPLLWPRATWQGGVTYGILRAPACHSLQNLPKSLSPPMETY